MANGMSNLNEFIISITEEILANSRHVYVGTPKECDAITESVNSFADCVSCLNFAIEKNVEAMIFHSVSIVACIFRNIDGSSFKEVVIVADGTLVFRYQRSKDDGDCVSYSNYDEDWWASLNTIWHIETHQS